MKHLNDKTHDRIIITICTLALFIIIILGSFNLMIFNKDFYYKEYSKNGVYEELPSGIDAKNITSNILKYFRNGAELEYFTDTEKSHMQDVKELIRTMQFIYYGAAVVLLILFFYCYKKFEDDKIMFIKVLARSSLYSSIAATIILVLIFSTSVFYFEPVFATFHSIFFPQGNWMFSPDSLLITLFPQQFFFDISIRIFIYAIFQALIFFGIGYWMHKQLKMVENHHGHHH
jgi:integral membrane protein (TIGR01906 family)